MKVTFTFIEYWPWQTFPESTKPDWQVRQVVGELKQVAQGAVQTMQLRIGLFEADTLLEVLVLVGSVEAC